MMTFPPWLLSEKNNPGDKEAHPQNYELKVRKISASKSRSA